jgi:threonine dehydratase
MKKNDYLERILSARVYDVADRDAARARARIFPRAWQTVLLKREDCSRCSPSSCAAPTTRWRACRRALERGVIAASAGNHAQGVALALRSSKCERDHRHAGHDAPDQGRGGEGAAARK